MNKLKIEYVLGSPTGPKTCRRMLWSFGSVSLGGRSMSTSCGAASFSPIP